MTVDGLSLLHWSTGENVPMHVIIVMRTCLCSEFRLVEELRALSNVLRFLFLAPIEIAPSNKICGFVPNKWIHTLCTVVNILSFYWLCWSHRPALKTDLYEQLASNQYA